MWPTHVVELNRAVAVGMAQGSVAGLVVADAIAGSNFAARISAAAPGPPVPSAALLDLVQREWVSALHDLASRLAGDLAALGPDESFAGSAFDGRHRGRRQSCPRRCRPARFVPRAMCEPARWRQVR